MIRTRDFVLFCVAVVFLVVSIAATLITQREPGSILTTPAFAPTAEDEVAYVAAVPDTTIDRSTRAAQLRAKIEALGQDVIAAIDPTPEPAPEAPAADGSGAGEDAPDDPLTLSREVDRCPSYRRLDLFWPARDIKTAEREGARVVFIEEAASALQGTTTSSAVSERIMVSLPVRAQPFATPTCLPHDVVGVALDGSLIRNDNHTLYGIFGAETLVGFSLDGFPIYGTNDSLQTDVCGGAMVGASYRYYLSSERDGVLGCFSAAPAALTS